MNGILNNELDYSGSVMLGFVSGNMTHMIESYQHHHSDKQTSIDDDDDAIISHFCLHHLYTIAIL